MDLAKYFPKHRMRIELFFGAGGSFFYLPEPKYAIVNDLDDDVTNLYLTIQNHLERLREADLDRHLSNGKAEESKREAEAKVAPEAKVVPEAKGAPKTGAKPAKPENEEDKSKKRESPPEFGSSDDLLLVQAISYIKENSGKRATAKIEN